MNDRKSAQCPTFPTQHSPLPTSPVELDQLRYFTATAEMLNFTRAAERCLVSQPSLSQAIIKLEHELGAALFERLGRNVRLTPAGRTFYEHAMRVLGAANAARDSLRAADQWQRGPASIGAILTVAPYLLPPILRTFTRKFPEAKLTVREDFTAGIVQAVVAGELDLGIAALPIDEPRLVVEPLFTEELFVALPARHPLATKRRKLSTADIIDESFVLLDETHCLGEQVVSFCRDRKFQPTVTCRTAQLLTVQSMVALGQGLSLVPKMATAGSAANKGIVYKSLGDDAPKRTLCLLRHRDRSPGRLVEELAALVTDGSESA